MKKDIWLLGGALLARSFAEAGLIDEIVLTIIPKKLVSGIVLNVFLDLFYLSKVNHLMDGIVQQIYLKNS